MRYHLPPTDEEGEDERVEEKRASIEKSREKIERINQEIKIPYFIQAQMGESAVSKILKRKEKWKEEHKKETLFRLYY